MFTGQELTWFQFCNLKDIKKLSLHEQVMQYNAYLSDMHIQRKLYQINSNANGASKTTDIVAPFNPDLLPNQFLYDSGDIQTINVSGSNVSLWKDKFLSGKDLSGVSNPVLFLSGGSNDKPYIKLSGGSSLDATTPPITTTPADIWMVIRTPSISANSIFNVAFNSGFNGLKYIDPTSERGAYVYSGINPFYLEETKGTVPRTNWMVVRIKWTDQDSLSIQINDEPIRFGLFAQNGISSAAYLFTMFQLVYPNMEISEIRLFSSLLSDNDADSLKSYLMNKYGISRPSKRIIVCGDSHTVGIQSGTPVGIPYMKSFIANTGYIISNYAASGTCAINNNTNFDFYDFVDNLYQYADSGYYFLINYGTNDCATASPGYGFSTWAQWKLDYKSKIQNLINSGYSPNKIILVTPPYSTGAYVAGNLSTCRTKIQEISSELGTQLIDWYQLCVDAGLDINLIPSTDGIHGNDAIHALMYNALIAITGI